jgi:hypothetical protein
MSLIGDFMKVKLAYCSAVAVPGLLFAAYVLGLLQHLALGGLMAHLSNFLGSACLMTLFSGPGAFKQRSLMRPVYALLAVSILNFAVELAPPIKQVPIFGGTGAAVFNFPDALDAIAGVAGAVIMLLIIFYTQQHKSDAVNRAAG